MTVTPTGHVKLEKGDVVLELNPHEWRVQLAPLAAGASAQTAVIEHTQLTIQLADEVRKLRRQLDGLKSLMSKDPKQAAIAF